MRSVSYPYQKLSFFMGALLLGIVGIWSAGYLTFRLSLSDEKLLGSTSAYSMVYCGYLLVGFYCAFCNLLFTLDHLINDPELKVRLNFWKMLIITGVSILGACVTCYFLYHQRVQFGVAIGQATVISVLFLGRVLEKRAEVSHGDASMSTC